MFDQLLCALDRQARSVIHLFRLLSGPARRVFPPPMPKLIVLFRSLLCAFIGLVFVGQASTALNAPTTLSTANLKATSFTLKWTAASGATGGIAGYDVYQNGTLRGSTTAASHSFAVTGLAPTTTYTSPATPSRSPRRQWVRPARPGG